MSLDFGLSEFGVLDPEERLKSHRRSVYEAGAVNHPQKAQGRVIDNEIVEHIGKMILSSTAYGGLDTVPDILRIQVSLVLKISIGDCIIYRPV